MLRRVSAIYRAFSIAACLLSWAWIALSILDTSFMHRRGVAENTLLYIIAFFSQARSLIDDFIWFYNNERIQLKIKLRPLQKRRQLA